MTKRMLIDATHEEETRVVILDGNRLEEFDFETSTKKQIKGNIYLAKVTRVEPSLQAAFVDYGGNRHGFLAFSEIHPDYYRIPVADREALLREHAAMAGGDLENDDIDALDSAPGEAPAAGASVPVDAMNDGEDGDPSEAVDGQSSPGAEGDRDTMESDASESSADIAAPSDGSSDDAVEADASEDPAGDDTESGDDGSDEASGANGSRNRRRRRPRRPTRAAGARTSSATSPEVEEDPEAARPRVPSYRRYKIQEVIKRRQILLVQVTKEERGNKGAALTTYLSLAGRYCVLMPNTARGGGISRKIGSAADRKRLKTILEDLKIPNGMAVIVRTAGSERSKAEVKRDYDYLMRLWEDIRTTTLQSTAPCLIHEEGNLIKRSIRDLYTRDIDEVQVEGDDGYKTAKSFMRMLMPSHAKRVQPYKDGDIPLLHRYQVESQLDAIFNPVAQLRSGGSIVIQPTEALVSIDVNSGRSTRERHIEETALKTNLEAADEVARQLRLRDLAGLIVVDFIDMEENRHNAQVERRLRDAMKNDRARIQIGRISPFGLMELSRQRMRPSLQETMTTICPHCAGSGFLRSTESTALHVLRAIEEEGIRRRSSEIAVHVPTAIALYILNQKRRALGQIEQRYGFLVTVAGDDGLTPPDFRLERQRGMVIDGEAEEVVESDPTPERRPQPDRKAPADRSPPPAAAEEDSDGTRRRRRRRRRRPDEDEGRPTSATAATDSESDAQVDEPAPAQQTASEDAEADANGEDGPRKRRRGKRGGRRRNRRDGDALGAESTNGDATGGDADGGGADGGGDGKPSEAAPETSSDGAEPTTTVAAAEVPSDTAAGTSGETAGQEGDNTATAASGSEPAEKPKRPRRPRSRKPAASKAADTSTDAKSAEVPAPSSQDDASAEPSQSSNDEAGQPPESAPISGNGTAAEPGPAAANDGEPAESPTAANGNDKDDTDDAPTPPKPERPKGPPRRGWWQRLLE